MLGSLWGCQPPAALPLSDRLTLQAEEAAIRVFIAWTPPTVAAFRLQVIPNGTASVQVVLTNPPAASPPLSLLSAPTVCDFCVEIVFS